VVLPGEFLDPAASELCPCPLLEHVVSRVEPAVVDHFLKSGTLPWCPLEDPHEEPGGLHGDLLVEPLELELDVEDVLFRFFGTRLSLEGKLAGKQDVEEDTQAPDVGLGEGLGLLQDLGGSIVKVVSSLDLGSRLGNSLGGLEVGQLDLDSLSKGPARADKDVGWFQVEVDPTSPGNVVEGIQHLSGDFSHGLPRTLAGSKLR